jgi:ornithine cyclodeaminase
VRILNLEDIRASLDDAKAIDCMRDALIASARGECATPMPMHLDIGAGEVHMKSSYRQGGKYFALKMATTFQGRGNGMILLASAETGEPVIYLADAGHLTDIRTAAVAAMVARELHRTDHTIGILGSGIQARLAARFHARVLPLQRIYLWGRTPGHMESCTQEIRKFVPDVVVMSSPSALAAATRLIVTCTNAREPLLTASDIAPGTHITAIGADSPGKQELDPAILRATPLLLVDSLEQCEKLGELQHSLDLRARAMEIGVFCLHPQPAESSVADLTGLGAEDLFIAESVLENSAPPN